MKALDIHYLSLQFKTKVLLKSGSEFQSFFEDIMEKAFPDFQRIRPYGNKGDGGNDGYRKELGIYYQVYAPRTLKANEQDAAVKFVRDFQKLKNEWSEISSIKEYNFVINDKYGGSVKSLEEIKTKLKANNPDIDFRLFLATDLENVFFTLSEAKILDLGFSIDRRQAIENAYAYLEIVKTELEEENPNSAQKNLNSIRKIISELQDNNLSLEYEFLLCRCLQKFEKIIEAREKYEILSKRYPNALNPILYLAEIYLNDKNFDKNIELLEKAEKIDSNDWLLRLEKLVRKISLNEIIDTNSIDEETFTDDPKVKASFYRLYALVFQNSGNHAKADSFIEKAIYLTPHRFLNYLDQLTLLEIRMLKSEDVSQREEMSHELLDKIAGVENKFCEHRDIGARNRANINIKKLSAFNVQDNVQEFEVLSKETFELAMACYFDKRIEHIFTRILQFVLIPDNDLDKLLDYLRNSKKSISDDFGKVLINQFNIRDTLFSHGKNFFYEIQNLRCIEFINNLENKNHDEVLAFLENDILFAVNFTNTLKNFPDLRKKIIENLPNDKEIQKEKLLLLLNFDAKDFDEAFQILKALDLSSLNYIECRPMLQIAQQKKAWDFEIAILEKLLEKEKNEKEIFNLHLQLFAANFNLNRFLETINIGQQLLIEDSGKHLLDQRNKEALLTNTIIACRERGKVDDEIFKKAKLLIETYPLSDPSFEYKAGIEAEVYLENNEVEKAFKSIIEGVKIKRVLSPHQYVKLYFLFSVKIGNRLNLTLDSLDRVTDNVFVKFKNKDRWYFIGDDNELDALRISKANIKYSSFTDKKVGDPIVFETKYSSEIHEEQIDLIFSIEKYVLWKSVQAFEELGKQGVLEGVEMIETPEKGDTIDLQNLLKFLEDLHKRSEPVFELYCKNNIPLAVLAISEGGLIGAIGRIQQEGKGFVNFSSGAVQEFEKQKEIAKRVVDEGMAFYIDGTSAVFLSEIGLFQKIYARLPNLKVPQSVINLLANITDRFRYAAGQYGHIGYAQGKMTFSSVDKNKTDLIRSNLITSIKLFEANPKNIGIISSANKIDCFSETKTPAELSDACILAQKEGLPVLTEDFLYLHINEAETGKKAPEYFSSLSLVRVFYEMGYLTIDEYLEYFGYLSSYRFRFLSLTTDDIQQAVFGGEDIKYARPENIRRFNFPLTISEEYGVPFDTAFRVVGVFLVKAIMNDAITVDDAENVFVEIIRSFPTQMAKTDLAQMFLGVCTKILENNASKFLCRLEDKLKYQKIDRLLQVRETLSRS